MKSEEKKALSNVYTLTAFFRNLIKYPYSGIIIDYLCKISCVSNEELINRWDGFDLIFGDYDYGKKISALSFSTIIEANTKMLDQIILDNFDDKSLILEIASGFSPRGIFFLNDHGFSETKYIETDISEVIELKKDFYNSIGNLNRPFLSSFNVIKNSDWENITKLLDILIKTHNIDQILIPVEGLLIYLDFNKQELFFNNLRKLASKLKKSGVKKIKFLSIEIPSHKNFTDWLISEGFSHDDHIKVMNNVDSTIISSLHKTDLDFFKYNKIPNELVKKYYYDNDFIKKLNTSNLEKYGNITNLEDKIENFLKQEELYAWEWEI